MADHQGRPAQSGRLPGRLPLVAVLKTCPAPSGSGNLGSKGGGVKNTGWQPSIVVKPEENKHVTERSQFVLQSIPRGRTLISAWGIPGPGGKTVGDVG